MRVTTPTKIRSPRPSDALLWISSDGSVASFVRFHGELLPRSSQ